MFKNIIFYFLIIFTLIISYSLIYADIISMGNEGDNPLFKLNEYYGPLGVAISAIPHSGVIKNANETIFTIKDVPANSFTTTAYFIVTSFSSTSDVVSAYFQGKDLEARPPDFIDISGNFICKTYIWDVTSIIKSNTDPETKNEIINGSYLYSFSGTSNVYGDILVVIYENTYMPYKSLVVNGGAESIKNSTTDTLYYDFAQSKGRLILFTTSDDSFSGLGESIGINGNIILSGDVFHANLGPFASLIDLQDIDIITGTNIVSVTTGEDLFCLHLAILMGDIENEPPIAVIEGPKTGSGKVGCPVKFDGSKSWDPNGDVITYRWDFGDGQTGTDKIVEHTYEEAGTYTVTLIVNDSQLNSEPAYMEIEIDEESRCGHCSVAFKNYDFSIFPLMILVFIIIIILASFKSTKS